MKKLFFVLLALMLASCGNQATKEQENTDHEAGLKKEKDIAALFYQSILDCDSIKMYGSFAADIDSFVPGLVETMYIRQEWWGKTESFDITNASLTTTKGDTSDFKVTFSALYQYGQSNDKLYIRKIGSGPYEIYDYDFDSELVLSCSEEKLKEIKPIFKELTENLANYRDGKLEPWFGHDKYFSDITTLRNEFFPSTIAHGLGSDYHSGHLRQYCGTRNSSYGFLTYMVPLGDTAERYITYVFNNEGDSSAYDIYRVSMSNTDDSDQEADIVLAKQLTKEVYRMMRKNNYKGFYNALHETIQKTNKGKNISDNEVKEIMERYKSLGDFKDFDRVTTLHIEGKNSDPLVFFVVIAELLNDEGEQVFVEIDFKMDGSGKIKLSGIEEM